MKKISLLFSAILISANCFSQNIGINTTGSTADVSAMLDIVASDKGLLLPRVSLSSNTDAATISGTEANSLIVFNTNGSMTSGNGKGYYYWDLPTLKWIYLAAASNGPGTIGQVLTSQGNGNNPQWTNPGTTGGGGGATGCAACITSVSTTEWTGLADWGVARDNCRNLVEGGYSDWRLPTFEEAVYYSSGAFDPPDGSWINDEIWTSTPATSDIPGGAVNSWVWIREVIGAVGGQWGVATYNSAINPGCRCVR